MSDKLPIHQGLTELQEMRKGMFWTVVRFLAIVFSIPLALLLSWKLIAFFFYVTDFMRGK